MRKLSCLFYFLSPFTIAAQVTTSTQAPAPLISFPTSTRSSVPNEWAILTRALPRRSAWSNSARTPIPFPMRKTGNTTPMYTSIVRAISMTIRRSLALATPILAAPATPTWAISWSCRPSANSRLNPGVASQPRSGFRSAFNHATEVAEADYYKVKLDDYNILAELTTTTRVGYHRYTFPASDQAHIILDLMSGIYNYEDKNVWTYVRVENDTLVTGYRETSGWGRTRTVYFAMAFSKPFTRYGARNFSKRQVYHGFWGNWDQAHNFPEAAGRQLRLHFDFHTKDGEQILLKFALSSVSTEGALLNLRAEAPGWDFDAVRRAGQAAWNAELNNVQIKASEDEKVNFYTSIYHAFINPDGLHGRRRFL